MNAKLASIVRGRPVTPVLSPVVQRVAPGASGAQHQTSRSLPSTLRPPYRHCIRVNATRDESPSASIDEAKLREEIIKIEVTEPVVEQKAENAALTVAAAVAFGAGIWAVLGRAKAEGEIFSIWDF
jgi:hypothetical protein